MKKIMTRTWRLALCLAAVAWIAACTRPAEAPAPAEIPTLDVTSWTDKTELFMEYPPLVAGQDGAVRGSPDALERLLRHDDGPAASGVHPGVRRGAGDVARRRAVAAGRVRVLRRGAAGGTLSLGARHRRARSDRSSRSRCRDDVRGPGGGGCRRGGACRGGPGRDHVSQGAAVDESGSAPCRCRTPSFGERFASRRSSSR